MTGSAQDLDGLMKPVAESAKGSWVHSKKEQLNVYQRVSLEAVGAGEVSFLILAGRQGTRLVVSYPKGMYSVGLMFNKTLFRLEADRFIKTRQLEF